MTDTPHRRIHPKIHLIRVAMFCALLSMALIFGSIVRYGYYEFMPTRWFMDYKSFKVSSSDIGAYLHVNSVRRIRATGKYDFTTYAYCTDPSNPGPATYSRRKSWNAASQIPGASDYVTTDIISEVLVLDRPGTCYLEIVVIGAFPYGIERATVVRSDKFKVS